MAEIAEKSSGFSDTLLVIAAWVDEQKYLNSIKDAFTMFMPFTIIGSFGSLLKLLISSPTTGLAQWIPALVALDPAFAAINFCCLSFMTIPIVYLIAHNIAVHNHAPARITGLVCIAAYISMVSATTTVDLTTVAGVTLAGDAATTLSVASMAQSIFGAQGLFVGMIVAILVSELFDKLITIDAIKIKMPPSVPGGIVKSFNVMVPS
jgi:PTS system cellobiose-specific IIC component